ncbi:hypothetical protein PGT21_008510 [Puccinia graminis f. sp. tritici]|uniref:Uncharacterized protein n=1 Tax=Puccinia graminis f. sp. tritici TaxID=56615 RepID=A0A5B0M582_PUCGR|nr:hypothetical protein PGT21_008510 [Puccinia graminis f. sp. tritici]
MVKPHFCTINYLQVYLIPHQTTPSPQPTNNFPLTNSSHLPSHPISNEFNPSHSVAHSSLLQAIIRFHTFITI